MAHAQLDWPLYCAPAPPTGLVAAAGACPNACLGAQSGLAGCRCVCGGANHGAQIEQLGKVSAPEPSEAQRFYMFIDRPPGYDTKTYYHWRKIGAAHRHEIAATSDKLRAVSNGNATSEEKDSLRLYERTTVCYDLNAALRSGKDSELDKPAVDVQIDGRGFERSRTEHGTLRDQRDNIAAAMRRNVLPEDTTVFRSIDAKVLKDLQAGDIIEDKGFGSTSVDPSMTYRFGTATLVLKVPQGMNYATSTSGREREVILPPGMTMRVIGAERHNLVASPEETPKTREKTQRAMDKRGAQVFIQAELIPDPQWMSTNMTASLTAAAEEQSGGDDPTYDELGFLSPPEFVPERFVMHDDVTIDKTAKLRDPVNTDPDARTAAATNATRPPAVTRSQMSLAWVLYRQQQTDQRVASAAARIGRNASDR